MRESGAELEDPVVQSIRTAPCTLDEGEQVMGFRSSDVPQLLLEAFGLASYRRIMVVKTCVAGRYCLYDPL